MTDNSQKNYPLSAPYQPPQAPAAPAAPAPFPHRSLALVGGAAVVLVVLVAGCVFLVKYLHVQAREDRAARPAEEITPEEKAALLMRHLKPARTLVTDEGDRPARKAASEDDEAPPRKKPAARAPAKAPPLGAKKAAPAKPKQELYLETVALLTVGHLYQTYLNIGLLADGVENDVYGKPEAVTMLADVTNTLLMVDRQLARLLDSQLSSDDEEDVQHVRMLSTLLRQQARELKAYWDDPTEEQARRYKKARETAWEGIQPLLEGEEKAGK